MQRDALPHPVAQLDPQPAPGTDSTFPPEAIQALDRHATLALGIPGEVLMENAAGALARLALGMVDASGIILILSGMGNNGGDGLAAHRRLAPRSRLLLCGEADRLRGLGSFQWQILMAAGLEAKEDPGGTLALRALEHLTPGDLIVDALLGTGLDREVTGPMRRVIEGVNASRARVLAVDIPSGLDGAEGRILGVAVRADATVTFAAAKRGLYSGAGPSLCGSIQLAGIGIPADAQNRFLAGWS